MYIVRWCGHDGNLNERSFRECSDATAEAKRLEESYDGVEIVRPGGERIYPIHLDLTIKQAASIMAATRCQRTELEHLRQDMITNLSPQEEIRAISREAARMAEVGKIIEEALL